MDFKFWGSLHNHTDLSNLRLRDSINKVESLIDYALELHHEVLAITEHETIASAIKAEKYYKKIKEKNPNFKLILGNEIYLCRNGLNLSNYNSKKDKFYHFILLAKDEIGHEQIREISTRAWSHSFSYRKMTRVPTYYQDILEVVGRNPGHIIASTACLGGCLPTQLLRYREGQEQDSELYSKIKLWCVQLRDLFGSGNFFLEMQPSFNKEQIYVNNKIIELSEELNIPFIITTDSHYLKKEDRPIHKAFLNSQNGDREVDAFYATTYLMNTEEICSYMQEYIGMDNLQKAFDNIAFIKDSCVDYSLQKSLKIPRLSWKQPNQIKNVEKWIKLIPELELFLNSPYEGDNYLAKLTMNKIEEDATLQNTETYKEINACFNDIWVSSEANKARWSNYLLNLQNIIEECWKAGSLVGAGRGSGVGFLLLYILGITQINPLREKTKTFRFRFLNPKRVSPLDVDIDIEGSKRDNVLAGFRKTYGDDRVANVMTIKTEKSKSAILTAARGLGIDVDTAQYLSSMIESDRGQLRTLKQTFYGDEENGISPNKTFQNEMINNYPELWEVAQYIEGLCCGVGVHAGGVIFVDEPFTKTTALMRSPKGVIITQLDLHDSEYVSNIKYDVLSIEALDKIHICLDLLMEYNYLIPEPTLKETYEKVIGIYNLERENKEMWEMVWEHEIMSLFQMEQQSGIQGIAILKPTSVDEMAILNSTIRLMAQEKGGEMPTQKLARFKNNPKEWDRELAYYGLGEKEKAILEPIVGISYGLCIAQEQFMQLVQLPELGGFSLEFADRLRKSIAKKNPAEFEKVTNEFFTITKEKNCNPKLCKYVWNVLICMSRGYGFNQSHTLAYSLIGLQEMNLAFHYPLIFWDCACLIADAGGDENDFEEEEEESEEEENYNNCIEEFGEEELEEENEEESNSKTSKKKAKKTNFGKIAIAIGKMREADVTVTPPDINYSTYTFSPDVKNSLIRYGLSGITRIGTDLIKKIINCRPYSSVKDFIEKINPTKPQMVNLIKSGAFDSFGDRQKIMSDYIKSICGEKTRLTLQNMNMLINFNLIPEELMFEKRVYCFNKYLKNYKEGIYFLIDTIAYNFYSEYFDVDLLIPLENSEFSFKISQKEWDNIYQKKMNPVRRWLKENKETILTKMNQRLYDDMYKKYGAGSVSKWEMDSCSFYSHKHELADVKKQIYGFENFFSLSEQPDVDREIVIKGKEVTLYNLHRIIGTVLDRNKNKKTVTLLTTDGVVTVKIFGQVFTQYDKQVSIKDATTGKKKVIEKSWFTRGNKIIVTGIRREDNFIAKKYSKTPYHIVELIKDINEDGTIEIQKERFEIEEGGD